MWNKINKKHVVGTSLIVIIALMLSLWGEYYFHEEKHFAFENIPFFEGLLGLFGALFLTLMVKITGAIVSKKEEDYDRYYSS
ncbi:MAG: hypothetical protein ACK4GE_02225 [Caldimicrobium sp.]